MRDWLTCRQQGKTKECEGLLRESGPFLLWRMLALLARGKLGLQTEVAAREFLAASFRPFPQITRQLKGPVKGWPFS